MESISINDWLWIQWKAHIISFRYKELAKGIHYTIAFNEDSSFINLHLTKNIKQEKENIRKPQIGICTIKKNDLMEIAPQLSQVFLYLILEEIEETEINKDLHFISFDKLENEFNNKGIEKSLIESFKNISKVKQKRRLKIKGDIESKLIDFTENDNIHKIFQDKIEIFKQIENIESEGGILISENNEVISIIKIHEKWYRINTEIEISNVLRTFLGNSLFDLFKKHIASSMKIIEKANNYEDCKDYDNPIHLELNNASR